MTYPEREPFFAHKFVRLLTKSCAAHDIGLNAFSLLCVIAHTEDAARYKGPVRYWNEQLQNTLALSPKQLRAARDKAIEFGWLHYSRQNDRSVGHYFVTVPARVEGLNDSPIEEQSCHSPCPPEDIEKDNKLADHVPDDVPQSTSNGTTNGHRKGQPSIPNPYPNPTSLPESAVFGEMAIPSTLTAQDLSEIARWAIAMRSEPTFAPGSESLQEKVRRAGALKKQGHSIPEMVSAAIAGSYKMLYPPKGQQTQASSPEWIKALNITRQHPDDWRMRQKLLGDDLFNAMKRTGTARVVGAHGAELGTLEKLFNENLKEIRNGITASN